jgi:hypothetical protein
MANRIEITGVSDELLKRVDDARGAIPRAAFGRLALEKLVETLGAPTANPVAAASPKLKVTSPLGQTWAR